MCKSDYENNSKKLSCSNKINSARYGREFMGELKKQLDNYNIKHIKSRPYNPKCQESVESFNKATQNRINTYKGSCLDSGENFNLEKAINDILNYYNNQQMHSSTKVLPNRVFYSSLISFCSF